MQAPPRRLVNASVLTATLRRASRIAAASKLTVSQLYLSQRSQATAAAKGETKKFTTSRSHKYLRFGCSPVSHAPAAMGAFCLGKSLTTFRLGSVQFPKSLNGCYPQGRDTL